MTKQFFSKASLVISVDYRTGCGTSTPFKPGDTIQGMVLKTMPDIREAIEAANWKDAQREISEAAAAIDNYTAQLNSATALLKSN